MSFKPMSVTKRTAIHRRAYDARPKVIARVIRGLKFQNRRLARSLDRSLANQEVRRYNDLT